MSERRTIVAVGTTVIVLGASVLVGGLTNLAIAPAMAARRVTPAFPVPLSAFPPSMAIAVLIQQNWPSWVALQLAFAATVLAGGIAFLRRRLWGRIVIEGLGWVGVAFLAVPIVWIARWVLATPADRMLGLQAGLQTLPSGVGQPIATVLQLFLGGPIEWGWLFLGRMGIVDLTAATQTILAWTPAGVLLGTAASLGIPVTGAGLIVFLRGRRMREAFRRSAS